MINPHRTIAIQLGHITLPELLKGIENEKIADTEKYGYNVTIDYRFYLAKENKYNAPCGVYITPYASIHHFKNVKEFDFKSAESNEFEPRMLNSRMNILSAGVALGYQFVVWDRMTLDFLLMGPSVSNYKIDMALGGELPVEELDENLQQIIENLADRFPFFNSLLEDQVAEFNGKTNFAFLGFRYSVGIGFRF